MSHVRTPTLVPGAPLMPGVPGHVVHPNTEPHEAAMSDAERVAAAVAREALSVMAKAGGTGRGQWAAILGLAAAFGAHVIGDGTVKAKAERTECLVEWLVERAVSEDRGEPPPPFSPLACAP